MEFICPHNPEVVCQDKKCETCGWNPPVARARVKEVRKNMLTSKLYKIPFTGYCEVWANSSEEALDKADDEQMFFVRYDFGSPLCLDKEEENEMDR